MVELNDQKLLVDSRSDTAAGFCVAARDRSLGGAQRAELGTG